MVLDYDLVIIGSGLVGTSFLNALDDLDLKVLVLEKNIPTFFDDIENSRPISLSYGSQQILEKLNVWQELANLASPIMKVHVSQQKHFGRLCFSAKEEHVPALGYVVPFNTLQRVLYERAFAKAHLEYQIIQELIEINCDEHKTQITFKTSSGEQQIMAGLLIGCDGTNSDTRKLLGVSCHIQDSHEKALSGEINITYDHQHVAYERFTSSGILAILPLKDPYRCRFVWSMSDETFLHVNSMDNENFRDLLQNLLGTRLGKISHAKRYENFSISTVIADQQVGPSFVLLGNSAHTLLPIAAQGFNLGLGDAYQLSVNLKSAKQHGMSVNDSQCLQSYLSARKPIQTAVINLTDKMHRFSSGKFAIINSLRAKGLLFYDLLPLKHKLASITMGLPEW